MKIVERSDNSLRSDGLWRFACGDVLPSELDWLAYLASDVLWLKFLPISVVHQKYPPTLGENSAENSSENECGGFLPQLSQWWGWAMMWVGWKNANWKQLSPPHLLPEATISTFSPFVQTHWTTFPAFSGFTFCRLMPALVKFQWRFLSFARFDCTSQKRTLHKAKSESLVNKSMSFAILITIGLIFSIGSTQIYCQVKKLSVPLPEM